MSDEPFDTPNRKPAPTRAKDSIVVRPIWGSHNLRPFAGFEVAKEDTASR
jgi:hypothetical protein